MYLEINSSNLISLQRQEVDQTTEVYSTASLHAPALIPIAESGTQSGAADPEEEDLETFHKGQTTELGHATNSTPLSILILILEIPTPSPMLPPTPMPRTQKASP